MFILKAWPKNKRKNVLTGRPKRTRNKAPEREKTQSPLEELFKRQQLSHEEYKTALNYLYAWQQHLNAIQAPLLRTTCLDMAMLKGADKHETYWMSVKNRWEEIQNLVAPLGENANRQAERTICYDMPCEDVRALQIFLQYLMNHTAHKKS